MFININRVCQTTFHVISMLFSGVYVFSQFPLLFAEFIHPLSLSRSLSLEKNNTNSTNECFYFIFELFECPHSGSNELLTFYACLSSGFPALFIYIRSGLQSEIPRSEHLCGLRFSLCNLCVCLRFPLFLFPLHLHLLLFSSFFLFCVLSLSVSLSCRL